MSMVTKLISFEFCVLCHDRNKCLRGITVNTREVLDVCARMCYNIYSKTIGMRFKDRRFVSWDIR